MARAATMTWCALSTTVGSCTPGLKSLPPGPGIMRALRIGEVALSLVLRHSRMLPACGRRLLCRFPGLRFQSGHGFPYLPDPALTKRQLCGQLIPTLVLAVTVVLLVIRFLGLLGPPANWASFSFIRL